MAGVFISYRRSDSAGHTGRLADYLAAELDDQTLFRDIEKIQPGEDFVEVLERAVASCSVMLVVIGPGWARAETRDGQRRLMQPGDFVRLEIETALARGVRVIPVLVGDASMPDASDLPESMGSLLRRHAHPVSDQRWSYDLSQLLAILEKVPGVVRRQPTGGAAAHSSPAGSAPAGTGIPLKVVLGVGAFVVAIGLAIFLVFAGRSTIDDPARTATVASPAAPIPTTLAPSASMANVAGVWHDEETQEHEQRVPWYFDQEGDDLVVDAGGAVGQDLLPATTKASDFPEYRGVGRVKGQAVTVELTQADTGTVTRWVGTVSPDGRTMSGKMTVDGADAVTEFTLRRD